MEPGTVLSNSPKIVEIIFKNLSALELCKCACVNKLWNSFSTAEINRRKKPVYFYQRLKCPSHKPDHTIILQYCTLQNPRRFEDELDQQIRNLDVKPAFCIAFANWTLWENFESLFPSHPVPRPKSKRFKEVVDDTSRQNYFESVTKTALKKRLPRNCQVALYFGKSIIDTKSHETDDENLQVPALSGYFLPELPQQGIQFCKRRNCDREVLKTISIRNDMKSALVLIEHKTLCSFAFRLKQILGKFNVFENGIVLPVKVGSPVVPLFFGSNVETACVNIPIANDKDRKIAEEMENKGAIGFIFGKYHDSMKSCWKFCHEYPLISIAGLCSPSKYSFESTDESQSYNRLIKEIEHFNFDCKIILISLKY